LNIVNKKMDYSARKLNKTTNSDFDLDLDTDQEKVEVQNNRIYYYSDVNEKSVLQLNKSVHKIFANAKTHAAQFDQPLESSGNVILHIQSYGGSVFSGLSAMDTLEYIGRHIPVTTIVDGQAASAATFISLAGTRRLMYKRSYMLIHQVSSGHWGKYEEFRDEMDNLDGLMNTIYDIYGEYTKIPKKELRKLLKRDLWLDSKTCLEYGLIDEII
jgi:ATP-dependent Clp endopeptidase proteolytic subunit ClpP